MSHNNTRVYPEKGYLPVPQCQAFLRHPSACKKYWYIMDALSAVSRLIRRTQMLQHIQWSEECLVEWQAMSKQHLQRSRRDMSQTISGLPKGYQELAYPKNPCGERIATLKVSGSRPKNLSNTFESGACIRIIQEPTRYLSRVSNQHLRNSETLFANCSCGNIRDTFIRCENLEWGCHLALVSPQNFRPDVQSYLTHLTGQAKRWAAYRPMLEQTLMESEQSLPYHGNPLKY